MPPGGVSQPVAAGLVGPTAACGRHPSPANCVQYCVGEVRTSRLRPLVPTCSLMGSSMTIGTASAAPTKEFFVRTLIRDISLDDCVLDLVDNSIDSAREQLNTTGETENPYQLRITDELAQFEIDVQISETEFSITDNCGGVSFDEAVTSAFTFGRRTDYDDDDWSVGVYGIGMKRAIFKLGQEIRVTSTHRESEGSSQPESFAVPINVPDWLASTDNSWDFDIVESEPLPSPGVSIVISTLTTETRARFEDPEYLGHLRRTLSRIYMLPLMQGLQLRLNGNLVTGRKLVLRSDANFAPLRENYQDGAVLVELVAGMVSPPPDDIAPDESARGDRDSGWYVICNGRVVVDADRTTLTGWGEGRLPRWHQQYSGFVGVAIFSSQDAAALPMTSTKRGVDTSAGIYRRALVRMYEPTRSWIDYTNARKEDLERSKQLEAAASSVEITNVERSSTVRLPAPAKRPSERIANVNYAVPLARMQRLALAFGNASMPFREVGFRSFNYAFEYEVEGGD